MFHIVTNTPIVNPAVLIMKESKQFSTTMLAQSFPPADDLISVLSEIDYKKHLNNFMDIVETICIYVAAICVVLWEKFQTVKITTPDSVSDYFYLNFNMRATEGDEIIGVSIRNYYVGLYNDSLNWGVLDENGCL